MTNPCVYQIAKDGKVQLDAEGKRIVDLEATAEYKNREVYSNEEIDRSIQAAEKLKTEYYQLRAKSLNRYR